MKPKLLIGMACYDDFDGVYFTIQSLRCHHADVMSQVEIAVVDNNPFGPHGPAVRDLFCWMNNNIAAAHYVPFTEINGTAGTRNLLFKIGAAPAVMCVDPHLLLWPGSIKKLIEFYDNNPTTMDLYQGPMVYDDMAAFSTHFDNRWDAEMWGKWANAWRCPDGTIVEPREEKNRVILYKIPSYEVYKETDFRWDSHRADMKTHGYKLAAEKEDDEPFEIPAMGLGLFSSRREAWLEFNPDFRGFGGEEWYIHLKYRQAGRKACCLPFLRWLHRFGRPNGIKYPITSLDKMRNYVIGHLELGLELDPVYNHFVKHGNVNQASWQKLFGK